MILQVMMKSPFQKKLDEQLDELSRLCRSAVNKAHRSVPLGCRADLEALGQLGLLEEFINTELAPAFALHYSKWGWSIELPCSLHDALSCLVEGLTRVPDAYLQAVFPSFWHAGKGPAARCEDPDFWRQVLRYPCGLNNTGEVYAEITPSSMLQSCRVQRKTVSWFSAARALKVYEEHLPRQKEHVRIWDPSGGFGARMLAAAAWGKKYEVGVTYMACEPASMTHGDLTRLGSALERATGSEFIPSVVLGGSEQFPAGCNFDLVFTSPPYFKTEKYFDEPGQCWRDYPVWEQWKGSYLRPTVETAKANLRSGGKLVLNTKHETDTWVETIGSGVAIYEWPVKAGPFARVRGEANLNEHLIVWEKP